MTLTQLEYIVALDKEKNFAKAAKSCFVSQPTLSLQIQKLEDLLQVSLFDRSKTPVAPTPIGRLIIEQAKVTLRESNKIAEIVKEKQNIIEGDFHLAVIPSVADTLIPLFLKDFTSQYPLVNLTISEMQTHVIIEQLQNEEIDAGIAATPLHVQNIKEERLYLEKLFAYLPPGHPYLDQDSLKSQQLKNQEVILMSDGNCFRHQTTEVCKLKEESPTEKRIQFESSNFETIKSLVDQGLGVTLLPQLFAAKIHHPKAKQRLKEIAGKTPSREISILYSRSVLKRSIVKAVSQTIQKNLPKEIIKNGHLQSKIIDPT